MCQNKKILNKKKQPSGTVNRLHSHVSQGSVLLHLFIEWNLIFDKMCLSEYAIFARH